MHVQQHLVEILSVLKEIRALSENLKLFRRCNKINQIQKMNKTHEKRIKRMDIKDILKERK